MTRSGLDAAVNPRSAAKLSRPGRGFAVSAVVASFVLALTLLSGTSATAVTPTLVRYIPDPWFSGHAGLYGWGMTTAQDGSVLIGDYWNYRVSHYAKDGTYLGDFYNNHGFGVGQTQSPYGLATDPNDGSVYIADTDRYQVVKVSATGQFITAWGTQGSGTNQFLYPSRVAVASDGRVFVADTWANSIVIDSVDDSTGTVTQLSRFGTFGTGPGQMKQPHGMAFYYGAPGVADDKLYVVDTNNKRIEVFDANGTYLSSFGKGTPGGKFTGDLRGLAIDQTNGWVYVVDAAGNNIDKYTVDGTYLMSFGSEGHGDGQFVDGGREITVDGDGNVWVGDMPNFRAQKFSPTGQFLLAVPDPPAPPPTGAFNGPRGVAVDNAGNIFVGDMYNQRIEKFAPDGTFLTSWGERGRGSYEFNYPRMIATDPNDGSLVVADTDNNNINKYANDGTFLWSVGSQGTALGQFKNPHGVDVGPDGNIYVADSRNSRVVVLGPDGTSLYTIGSVGSGNGQFRFPRGVTVAPDGTLWVVDSTRHIVQHFTTSGTYLGKFGKFGTTPDSFDGPFDIAADTNYLYIADSAEHRIDIYTNVAAPKYVTSFGSYGTAPGQMISPDGLDIGPNGHLFVAEEISERISEWDISGSVTPPDTVPPTVAITLPTQNQTVSAGPIAISGTAGDDVGVTGVQIAIRNRTTLAWWNPSTNTWGSTTRTPVNFISTTLGTPGALSTNWTYIWNGASPASLYTIQARASDGAGNLTPTLPSRPFKTA